MSENKKTILIVEDEKVLSIALKESFKKNGFLVLTAENGQEGLDLALKEHPDYIMIDILMPIMDGLTMLKKIREDSWGKDVPATILTNFNDIEKVAEATGLGVFDYLVKTDWTIDEIIKKVEEKI
ncbi:MAG: response regulator [bacterium]|nr:response regulator [bacterium]